MRPLLGCGFHGFEDRGEAAVERYPEVKTCPQYLARTPFVASVWQYLTAFRVGGLGNAMDLPHGLFVALTLLDSELKLHDGEIKEQLLTDD